MNVTVSSAAGSNDQRRFPRVDVGAVGVREAFMRVRVDLTPYAYTFMSIEEAQRLHEHLGAALEEAGCVLVEVNADDPDAPEGAAL